MIWTHSRRGMVAVAVAVTLGCAVAAAAAERGVGDDPYMRAAVSRTRVEIAFRDAEAAFDPAANGYSTAWADAEKAKRRLDQLLTAAVEQEQERGETRAEGFIAGCEQRLNRLEELWTALDEQTRPTLDATLNKVTVKFEAARDVLARLIEQEADWKKAGIDLAALEAAYAAIEKRLTQLGAEAGQVVKSVKTKQAELENEMHSAETFLAERNAAPKQAATEPGPAAPPAPTAREE